MNTVVNFCNDGYLLSSVSMEDIVMVFTISSKQHIYIIFKRISKYLCRYDRKKLSVSFIRHSSKQGFATYCCKNECGTGDRQGKPVSIIYDQDKLIFVNNPFESMHQYHEKRTWLHHFSTTQKLADGILASTFWGNS